MFKNLLLALDVQAPESSVRSAQAAVTLARTEGATLHVLNVVPDSGMPIVGASLSADLLEKARRSAKSELEEWAKQAIPDDVECVLHITEGTIYDQIIKMSDKLADRLKDLEKANKKDVIKGEKKSLSALKKLIVTGSDETDQIEAVAALCSVRLPSEW